MRFIDSSVEIIEQEPGILGVYKQIEKAARLSYKSEDRITEDSAKKMVDTLVKNKHLACLEHGTIYLEVPMNQLGARINSKYISNKYSTSRNSFDCYTFCITTNARVLVENGWLDDLQYMFNPTEYHKKRISVKFTTSIGITRELIRHRAFSFMNESTRYCNYSKGKFGSELTFVIPEWIYNIQAEVASYRNSRGESMDWIMSLANDELLTTLSNNDEKVAVYWDCLSEAETTYNFLINNGLKAQDARSILPLDTKSEIIMTGFIEDWIHFFALRSYIAATGKPHPDVQKLADILLQEFLDRGYISNEDVDRLKHEKQNKQSD